MLKLSKQTISFWIIGKAHHAVLILLLNPCGTPANHLLKIDVLGCEVFKNRETMAKNRGKAECVFTVLKMQIPSQET